MNTMDIVLTSPLADLTKSQTHSLVDIVTLKRQSDFMKLK